MNDNDDKPPCSGCEQRAYMKVETKTAAMKHWHCNYCGTKTKQVTTFGAIKPFISLLTLGLFGASLD